MTPIAERVARARARVRQTACERRPELWFSSNPEDVAYAAGHCAVCPLRAACVEKGRDELYGVWGTADRFELLEPVTTPQLTEHVPSRYCFSTGCRRPECRAENAKYQAAYRANGPCHKTQKAQEAEQLLLLEVS